MRSGEPRRTTRTVRALGALAVVALMAVPASLLVTVVSARPAEASYSVDIGGDDTLVVLTPWETRYMDAILSNPRSNACSIPGLGRVSRVISVMNRICGTYKLRNRALFYQLKWLLWNATQYGGCGAFVIDDASWRRPRIRAAESWSWSANNYLSHVSTNVGGTGYFRTKTGYHSVRCSEYAQPSLQSPLVRAPQPSAGGGGSSSGGGGPSWGHTYS